MDYSCAKFGDFNFRRFRFIVRQTDRQTEPQTHYTHSDNRRMSIVLIRVCDSVCLSVCLSVRLSVCLSAP